MSTNKLQKTDKKKHFGRSGNFLKHKGKGVRGCHFFTSSQRRENNKFSWED